MYKKYLIFFLQILPEIYKFNLKMVSRVVRRKKGRGVVSDLNDLAKETKIISKGLEKFGINPLGLGGVAKTLGYGRKRKRVMRKRRGGALFEKVGMAVNRIKQPQFLKDLSRVYNAVKGGRKRKRVVKRRRGGYYSVMPRQPLIGFGINRIRP